MNFPATFEQPTTDKLTGLASHSYFRHLLRDELLPKAEETGESLCLFILDTDDFLSINKTHGHLIGDEALVQIARVLQSTLPETAFIARYGGDEFAGVLPDTRLDDAFTLLEEVRRRVAAATFEPSKQAHLTATIGLAAFPVHGKRDVELLREADQALYLAKSTGRNKVSIPLTDSRMITKTSYYTATQLERLAQLAKTVKRNEATLLREALDDLLKKYNDRLGTPPQESKS